MWKDRKSMRNSAEYVEKAICDERTKFEKCKKFDVKKFENKEIRTKFAQFKKFRTIRNF